MNDAQQLSAHLVNLGLRIREHISVGRDPAIDSKSLGVGAGDTIFALDRKVEPLVLAAMEALPTSLLPVLVVCEGLGRDGRQWVGPTDLALNYQILIDPIDGTRSLMYDKRSAWFLATAAPDHGADTRVKDSVTSVMIELPTSKQGFADEFILIDRTVVANRRNLVTGNCRTVTAQPSTETTLRHGFAQVSSFFPGIKVLAADLMETIASATLGVASIDEASIFDDQYICTGGQMAELMIGHDRFCCDLRPIFFRILNGNSRSEIDGLCCHPYDLAGMQIAKEFGVIFTDGYGHDLDIGFDVKTNVHWCGYANGDLRNAIEPIIQRWLRDHLGSV